MGWTCISGGDGKESSCARIEDVDAERKNDEVSWRLEVR
jgi:hypothetical protein